MQNAEDVISEIFRILHSAFVLTRTTACNDIGET